MNITWDAQEYSDDFSFVYHYGEDVLKLLEIRPGDTIIDLGCGNGALTMRLEQAGAHAIGIDASEEMLSMARRDYPALDFRQADALNFTIEKPADALFSNAVFHWIDKEKQPLLLRQINRALKPHGQLVCEFGGKGCAARVHASLRKCFEKEVWITSLLSISPRLVNMPVCWSRRDLKWYMPFYSTVRLAVGTEKVV